MTSQYDFTNAEWNDIAALPVLVGFAMAKAGDSGFVGSLVEVRTLAHELRDPESDGPAKTLIEAASMLDIKDKLDEFDKHDAELLGDVAVQACEQVSHMLAAKAEEDEASGFRRWILHVAREVAQSAKEDGVRVSEPEVTLLGRLEDALAN